MLRLADQPRPIAWKAMRHFSRKYRSMYEARHVPDWQRIVLRRALHHPGRKLLYTINAKAASSSLRDMMSAMARADGTRLISFPRRSWSDLAPALSDPAVYRFTVARHPVSRAVSSFVNLFVNRNNGFEWRHIPYMWRTGLKFGDSSSANFERFLDYVEEVMAESEMFCDVHLRLQTHNIGARHMSYDRIGHYETLVADIAQVMAEAGVTDFQPGMLGWVNRALSESGPKPTPAQIARIEAIYAEDYERMGYARDGGTGA
jgi:hypothetical protein